MTSAVADSSIRPYAKSLFAEIAVRIVAYALDMVLIIFLLVFLDDHVFRSLYINDELQLAGWAIVTITYFTVSWISPLHATPTQFLFGMRVLSDTGEPLSLRDAIVRSVALTALWGFCLFVLQHFFTMPGVWLKIIAVALLLYVPSVTARRQAPHDFLARSVVINKRSLRSGDDEHKMRDFLADRDPAVLKMSRPSIVKMGIDAVVLAIPLYAMVVGIEVSHHKNMYARTAYALYETEQVQFLAESWFEATGEWPATEEELGAPLRHNYPDGGYFELEEGGVIRIQFEVLPELKNGSILLEPAVKGGEVTWQCRLEGNIERRYVPTTCRD